MTHPRDYLLTTIILLPACFYNPTVMELGTSDDATTTGAPGSMNTTSGAATTTTTTAEATSTTAAPPVTTSTTEAATSGAEPVCGDGAVERGEQCDDGNDIEGDACTNACTLAYCGDGIKGPGEQCDDGDRVDDDACGNDCLLPSCGDGVLQAGETCDDGDLNPGDTCSPDCTATNIAQIAIGGDMTCLVFADGSARCWGDGGKGALGTGATDSLGDEKMELPVQPIPLGIGVASLGVGDNHMCALSDTGDIHCWGNNSAGQLGRGSIEGDLAALGDQPGELPVEAVAVGGGNLAITAGANHNCVITSARTVRCWGSGYYGQLGYGSMVNRGDDPDDDLTEDVAGLADVQQIGAGFAFTCALSGDGKIRCWGDNYYGQLGLGHTDDIGDDFLDLLLSVDVDATPGNPVAQLGVGNEWACARLQDGNVRCWGNNEFGQCGIGDKAGDNLRIGDQPSEMPPPNVNIGGVAEDLVMGTNHACVRLTDQSVRCWGRGSYGRLGSADVVDIGDALNEMPPPPLDLGGETVALSTHLAAHTCALVKAYPMSPETVLRCWGYNATGQLGYGHKNNIGDDEAPASAPGVPY